MTLSSSIYLQLDRYCFLRSLIVLLLSGVITCVIGLGCHRLQRKFSSQRFFFWSVFAQAACWPFVFLCMALGFVWATEWLCVTWQTQALQWFYVLKNLSFIMASAWFLWGLVTRYSLCVLDPLRCSKPADSTAVYALSHLARLAILTFSALSLLRLFGLSLAGVLAFGGMGGIVIGFAAKDLLANLFGSLLIFLDRPFVIGDQINLPTLKVAGKVEAISWRACQLLTEDCHCMYIPNALFSNLIVENRSRIYYRRFRCRLNLRYQDLAKIPLVVKEIESLLRVLSGTDKTRPVGVMLSELAASSLVLSVTAYTTILDGHGFSNWQQQIYLQLLDCLQRYDVKWAFPGHVIAFEGEKTRSSP